MQINDTNSHLPYIQPHTRTHTRIHTHIHTYRHTLRARNADTPTLAKLKWETRATPATRQLKGGLPMVKFSLGSPLPLWLAMPPLTVIMLRYYLVIYAADDKCNLLFAHWTCTAKWQ